MKMQLFRIIPLEKDLWAINEIDKTVMYVINGTEELFFWIRDWDLPI